jgi:hypothetical protein
MNVPAASAGAVPAPRCGVRVGPSLVLIGCFRAGVEVTCIVLTAPRVAVPCTWLGQAKCRQVPAWCARFDVCCCAGWWGMPGSGCRGDGACAGG